MDRDYIDEERVHYLSIADKDVPLYQKIIKLQEESGELAQAFLKYDGAKNTSVSASGSAFDIIEETCDVINVAMDIMNAVTMDNDILEEAAVEMFQTKLDKWEKKQNDRLAK